MSVKWQTQDSLLISQVTHVLKDAHITNDLKWTLKPLWYTC
jgi:hypothetical protein